MKKNIFYGIKVAVFTVTALLVVTLVNRIENPKYFYNNSWPTTATYTGFYKMPKDSVDVLFFGSSHAASGFNPQELYDRYGITSYNLGCEQQNLLVSYYWLKEALDYQKPKVVVVDTYMLQWYSGNEPLNTAESCTRKAIDYMRWGKAKVEAVHDIAKYDSNQSLWSYYLTNIRFHTRWSWLGSDDFADWEGRSHFETKGYAPLNSFSGNTWYQPFSERSTTEQSDLHPLMLEYMDKIVSLCEENGIQLLLVKNPTTATSVVLHNSIKAFAAERNLEFVDMNDISNYRKLGFHFSKDMADDGHPNVSGAMKITDFVGKILVEQYGVTARQNTVWEETKQYYQELKDIFTFSQETDIVRYLKKLNSDRYSVFIAVKDEASNGLSQEVVDAMQELGLAFDLADKYRHSYIAIKTEDEQYEELSTKQITRKGMFRKNKIAYNITSSGYDCGNYASINLGGTEYCENQRGLNIVVYDNISQTIIDSVCFDTFDTQITAIR